MPPKQDGGHLRCEANENIYFLVAWVIYIQKIYSFRTPQNNPAKLHNEPDYHGSLVYSS